MTKQEEETGKVSFTFPTNHNDHPGGDVRQDIQGGPTSQSTTIGTIYSKVYGSTFISSHEMVGTTQGLSERIRTLPETSSTITSTATRTIKSIHVSFIVITIHIPSLDFSIFV